MKWNVTSGLCSLVLLFSSCNFNENYSSKKSSEILSDEERVVIEDTTNQDTVVEEPQTLTIEPSMDISEYRDEDFISIARAAIQAYENQVSYNSWFKSFEAQASAVQCGAVITGNVTVSGTLDCSNYNGKYALVLYGNNAKLDGGSNKLKIIFPHGKVGILVYGNSAELKNVNVSGMSNGMGILLYDSDQGKVRDSIANNNLIGITVYAENVWVNQPTIEGNTAQNNALFGIRMNDGGAGKKVANPKVHNNDLSNSGNYALHIRTDNLEFGSNKNKNILTGSKNGWYLTGGNFQFNNMNINTSDYEVEKVQVFVAEASQISMSSVKLWGLGGTVDQEAYGLHVYKTSNISINNCDFKDYDVGVKIASEAGKTSIINLSGGVVSGNSYAGVILQAYDNGTILLSNVNNVSYSNNGFANRLCSGALNSCQ